MYRKKRKIDFAAEVSASGSLLKSVDAIKKCATDLKVSVDNAFELWGGDLDRLLSRCNAETLELMLVSRLGLEGVDCMRNALQMIPPSFLGARNKLVCDMVNLALPTRKA